MATTLLKQATPLIKLVLILVFIGGLAFALLGVWLVYLGSTGSTEFSFFGQNFKATSVGIAAIFIGAVAIVNVFRRALKTVDQTLKAGARNDDTTEASLEWPIINTVDALKARLRKTSEKNRAIIQCVAEAQRPVYVMEIAKAMTIDRSQVIYRGRDLNATDLFEILQLTDTAYDIHPAVRNVLGKNASRKLLILLQTLTE